MNDSMIEIERHEAGDFASWIFDIGNGSVQSASVDVGDELATIKNS